MSQETLHLPEDVRRAIEAHAVNCAPDECCGLIASSPEAGVQFAYPLTNCRPSPTTYTIDPDEHYAAFHHAETMGWALSGVFHSHPSGDAEPSVVDIQRALEPDWLYLIIARSELRGFRIRDNVVSEIDLT